MSHLAAAFGSIPERFVRLTNRLYPLLILVLPALLLLPGAGGFPFSSATASFSDLAISHYPYGLYLQRSLLAGRLPLWFPSILSGAPFAANPLAGLWYPPGWLALIFQLPTGFNIVVLLHLFWGGWGLFRLLRREGLGIWAALFGGAAFSLLPKFYTHYGAGHLTLLYAVPWTPWLLLAARRASERKSFSSWEAVILALIFTADPRWSVYAGITWLVYRLFHAAPGLRGKTAAGAAIQTLAAGLLSAPLALPLLEYASLSTRSLMTAQDLLTFSLPPERLLGLLYPDFGGFHEYALYAGQTIFAAFLLGWVEITTQRAMRFWRWIALLGLIWSIGASLPFAAKLFSLPGLDLLRVPSRALFLVGLGMCALAAHIFDTLASPLSLNGISERAKRYARLMLAAAAALSLALTGGVALAGGSLPPNFAWGSAFLLVAAVWIGLRLGGRLSLNLWWAGLALLTGSELFSVGRTFFDLRPAARTLAESREVAEYLAAAPGHFRVYSPSYSLAQQTAAALELELADGVDPLQLISYVDYMEIATGVPRYGYSVTLPPFANGEPAVDNAAFRPDAGALGLLNVAYVVSAFPQDAPGLLLERQLGATWVYRNERVRPYAWVKTGLEPGSDGYRPARVILRTPERIELHASGPGVLVLSETNYPGWEVSMDGSPQEMLTAAGLLRAVRLTGGEHQVVFTFHPLPVYAGLALSVVVILAMFTVRLLPRALNRSRE